MVTGMMTVFTDGGATLLLGYANTHRSGRCFGRAHTHPHTHGPCVFGRCIAAVASLNAPTPPLLALLLAVLQAVLVPCRALACGQPNVKFCGACAAGSLRRA